jgi:flagellar protein FliO/FliZ
MDFVLKMLGALFGLAATLGLFGLAVWGWRRFAPASLLPTAAPRERRMKVIETLVMGTNHRLVLVRLDGQDRLVLLGEGSLLGALPLPQAKDVAKDPA